MNQRVQVRDAEAAGPWSGLQVLVGLLAGLAALIYLTGGAALGLRLLWAGLPTLSVGQLPREFLFSLGAAQVVAPALAVGLVLGFAELGQDLRGMREGHLRWSEAKAIPRLRRAYLAFYGTIPLVLVAPGVAVAIATDDRIDDQWTVLAAVGGIAAILLAIWIAFQRSARPENRGSPEPGSPPKLGIVAWSAVLGPGLLLSIGFGLWMRSETDGDERYFAVVGAWAVALFFSLLTVWLRSRVGERTRKLISDAGDDAEIPPWLVAVSWSATALLAVPACIAVTAAWPLTDAVVCAQQLDNRPYVAAGQFVGETKDRVYVGVDGRLISVPAANVSQLAVGSGADERAACARAADPPPR